MTNTLNRHFEAMRDRACAASVRAVLNRKFERFGRIVSLDIDSRQRTLRVEFELKGEATPIAIRAGRYELAEEDGSLRIVLRDIQASREWITAVLDEYVAGHKFRLPQTLRLAL